MICKKRGRGMGGTNINLLSSILLNLELNDFRSIGHHFKLIFRNAVWKHLPATQRENIFRFISEILVHTNLVSRMELSTE